MMKHILLLAFVLILTGCKTTASGPLFVATPVPSDKARIYIFRPQGDVFMNSYADVRVDEQTVSYLRPEGYVQLDLPPEYYRFTMVWRDQYQSLMKSYDEIELMLDLEPGKIYYLSITSDVNATWQANVSKYTWRFDLMDAQKGALAVADTRLDKAFALNL